MTPNKTEQAVDFYTSMSVHTVYNPLYITHNMMYSDTQAQMEHNWHTRFIIETSMILITNINSLLSEKS